MSQFADKDLELDRRVYQSEAKTGLQNQRIAQVLYEAGIVETEVDRDEGLQAYFMACSTLVSCEQLALMGATLANAGKNPKKRMKVLDPAIAESVCSVMMSCGMYNGAGNWMVRKLHLCFSSALSEDFQATTFQMWLSLQIQLFQMDVGLPAKSGVSGCLMAVVPGVCGIAVWSPPLNEHGNSVRAIETCTHLSINLGLHVLKKVQYAAFAAAATLL